MQGPNAYRISEIQREEFVRTANALVRDGVLSLETEPPKHRQQQVVVQGE